MLNLLLLLIEVCFTCVIGVESKSFYRTRHKKLVNGTLIKTVSTLSHEDCLIECFTTEDCNTFNTIEITTDKHECQLFKNHRTCNLITDSDDKASVYFSAKECTPHGTFKLKLEDKYLKVLEDGHVGLGRNVSWFIMVGDKVMLNGTSECLALDSGDHMVKLKRTSANCLRFTVNNQQLELNMNRFCLAKHEHEHDVHKNVKGFLEIRKTNTCTPAILKVEYKIATS